MSLAFYSGPKMKTIPVRYIMPRSAILKLQMAVVVEVDNIFSVVFNLIFIFKHFNIYISNLLEMQCIFKLEPQSPTTN